MKINHVFLIYNTIFISFITYINSSLKGKVGKNPYLKKLNNNKYLLISSKGLLFLDETLTKSSNEILFEEEAYDDSFESMASTTAVQFPPENDSLILAILQDNLYIFHPNETLLINQIIIYGYYTEFGAQKPYYLFPYSKINNTYITILISLNDYDSSDIIVSFQKIIYNYDNNTIFLTEKISNKIYYYPEFVFIHSSIGCGLMNYNNSKIVNCVYGIMDYVHLINFDPENNFSMDSRMNISYKPEEETNIYFFKSITLPEKNKIIHCFFFEYFYLECIKYDIESNSINIFHHVDFSIMFSYEQMFNLDYFEENKKIVISFIGFDPNRYFFVYDCSLEGNCTEEKYTVIKNISVKDIYNRANLVIPKDKLTYQIFAFNENIDNYLLDLGIEINLICDNYYNYLKTSCLNEIPEGYYCNNTEDKTIDKCHDNCKTCNKSPTEDNNNCLTCKDNDTIFYDLGNCRSYCINGFFIDNIHNLTCKCTNNIECLLCNDNNLCKNCNNEKGYYQKNEEEVIDDYVKCYKDPEGYYLLHDKYYPCYSTCQNCREQGNSYNNKCTECKEGYEFRYDFENDTNCYNICEYYYYFDENKNYYCTPTADCPLGYGKLIDNKTCIKNVINQYDTNYIYNENIIYSTDNLNNINSNKTNIDIKDNNDIIETMINISYLNNDFDMHYKINELLYNECNISLSIEKIIEQIRNSIKNNEINELLEEIINNKKDFTKKIGNITIQLISLENQDKNKKENISIIDFRECEDILRINYGLENNSILLYKIDIPIIGYHTMVVNQQNVQLGQNIAVLVGVVQ